MKKYPFLIVAGAGVVLNGCGGAGVPPTGGGSIGGVSFSIVGAAQSPVTSSAAYGGNVTAIAGALIDQMTLNHQGPNTLNDTKIAFYSTRDGNSEVYLMNIDGTNPIRITNHAATDYAPSWSPDGSKLAFATSRDGNYEVYTVNSDGTNLVRLTNNPATDYSPSWSPDGTKIAFSTTRDGNTEIYTMNPDGTAPTRLTNNAATDYYSTWSPDSAKIAFTSFRDGNFEIYSMNADGTNQVRLTNNTATDENPSWSPDGTKIAFDSYQSGTDQIYTMNANGTSQTNITGSGSSNEIPSWSPDGSQIVFASNRDGNFEIYTCSPNGSNVERLTVTAQSESYCSWSGYLPRTPKTLVGVGGSLGTAAAGFLYGQRAGVPQSIVAFDTSTPGSRSGARVASQTANETNGSDIIMSVTTTAGLASVNYVNMNDAGVPGAPITTTIPVGSTAALVSFIASSARVGAVIPYAANRGSGLERSKVGDEVTFTGSFTAVFDASGKNLAEHGASSVTINGRTGELVRFK